MEVRADVTLPEMGKFRWLGGPARPGGRLDRADGDPRPAGEDEATADEVRSLMAKGFAGAIFLTAETPRQLRGAEGPASSSPRPGGAPLRDRFGVSGPDGQRVPADAGPRSCQHLSLERARREASRGAPFPRPRPSARRHDQFVLAPCRRARTSTSRPRFVEPRAVVRWARRSAATSPRSLSRGSVWPSERRREPHARRAPVR